LIPAEARKSLSRLWAFGRPHTRVLVLAFGCMVVLGATTGLYAFLMGPVVRFLLSGGSEGLSLPSRVFPVLTESSRERVLWLFPVVLVLIGVVKGVAYLGQFYWTGLFGQRVVKDLRRALFIRLSSMTPIELSRHRVGDLLSRFTVDVAAVEVAATYSVASYLRDSLQIVILVGVALVLSWKLALFMLFVVPVAAWPVSRFTRTFLARVREGQASLGLLAAR
jgi:ATP-binding cassette, subfamily B, bacterial MsbA